MAGQIRAESTAPGDGTVFELAAGTHALTTLVSFNKSSGSNPEGGLVADSSGNFYGTASTGGTSSYGTIFEVHAGTHTVNSLVDFNFTNGDSPNDGLIADSNGNLYGTTNGGGSGDRGTVFKLSAGTFALSTLASFGGMNGFGPEAGLPMDSGGNFYGVTPEGGSNNEGLVFEVAAGTHALSTVVSFNGPNGALPVGALLLTPRATFTARRTKGERLLARRWVLARFSRFPPIPTP